MGREQFAMAVSSVGGRSMRACGAAFNDRARSRTSVSFVISSIAHTAAGLLRGSGFGSSCCSRQISQTHEYATEGGIRLQEARWHRGVAKCQF